MDRTDSHTTLHPAVREARAEDAAGAGFEPSREIVHRIGQLQGRPLPGAVARAVTPALGGEIGDARVHVGQGADAVLDIVGAPACCLGREVLVSRDAVADGAGATMLLHELAHLAAGPRHDLVRCWNAKEHADLSDAASRMFRSLLEQVATSANVTWETYIRQVREASSNMDFRGRLANLGGTADYLLGTKGEGPSHGEGMNYVSTHFKLNEQLNVREQARHVNMAVSELLRDNPVLTIGSESLSVPGRPPGKARTSFMVPAWIRSLGNAFHVAQDRGSHREGTRGYGHDDPRCASGWSPDAKMHDHSAGKGWDRCGEAAYNRALNNSLDVVRDFLHGIKAMTSAKFTVATVPTKVELCP